MSTVWTQVLRSAARAESMGECVHALPSAQMGRLRLAPAMTLTELLTATGFVGAVGAAEGVASATRAGLGGHVSAIAAGVLIGVAGVAMKWKILARVSARLEHSP